MKKLVLIAVTLLTMVFFPAMPLQAATEEDAPACVTFEGAVTATVVEQVAANGGEIVDLKGLDAQAFLSRLEELLGSNAPFPVDRIVLVLPTGEPNQDYNIGLFSEGCLKTILTLPASVVSAMRGLSGQEKAEDGKL